MTLSQNIELLRNKPPLDQIEVFNTMLESGDLQDLEIQEILETSRFFTRWMEHATAVTDAPDEFLAVGGLQLVSSILQNHSYIEFGNDKIYPHLWVVLLAPSSYFHKTTVLNLVKRTLADIRLKSSWDDLKIKKNKSSSGEKGGIASTGKSGKSLIAPDRFSIDYLVEELSKRPSMLLVQSEFGSFLKEIDKTFNQGAKETLTEIYDSGIIVKSNKTILAENNGEPIEVDNTALSILSASTKDWLEEYVKLSDVSAGFIARFIFVPADRKTRFYAWPQNPNDEIVDLIKQDLAAISEKADGEITTSVAKPLYKVWYKHLFDRVHTEETVSKTIGFDQRLSIYALKFAMIIHAANSSNNALSIDSMVRGIALAEYFRAKIRMLFQTTFLSRFDKNKRQIAEFIFRNDHKLTNRKIQQRAGRLGIRAAEFNEIMHVLKEDGDVHFDADDKASISAASIYLKGIIRR
jgi:hypothetical protein